MRSRSPNGVRTESNAIEPTTVSDISGCRRNRVPGMFRVKAIQIEEFGGPEVMQHVEMPDPEPGDGEVVVDVARAGINFADTHVTRNDYLAEQPLPLIPGGEIAGTDPDGRRVAAILASGGYAQKVAVPEALLVPAARRGRRRPGGGAIAPGGHRPRPAPLLRPGRRRGDRRRRGRRRRHRQPRGPARQARRRQGDRARLQRGEARALPSAWAPTRPPTPAPTTSRRRFSRPTAASGWTSSST